MWRARLSGENETLGPSNYLPDLFGLAACSQSIPATAPPSNDADLSGVVEPAAREALRLVSQAGPGEVVPGFAGLFLDANDNSIVYVYMLDPSQQEAAELAARIILDKSVTEVRVLQGKYSWGHLLGWYREAQDIVWPIAGLQSSDIDEGLNRIEFNFQTSYSAQQAREALATTSIPDEAVVFNVAPQQQLDDPPIQLESPIGVSISLEVEDAVPAGQPVSIKVVLTNDSGDVVEFDHGVSFHENVMVFTPEGDQVWAKIRGGVLVGTGGSTQLQPGEQVRLETLWDQRDQDGFPQPEGRYLVRGAVRIHDNPYGFYRAMDLATGPYEFAISPQLAPTPTPAPMPPSRGVHTPEDFQLQYEGWPEEHKFAINDDVNVRFAYPSDFIDWAWFALVAHVPSASTVTFRRPWIILNTDSDVTSKESGELLWGEELIVRTHYETGEGEAHLEAVLADEALMRRILSRAKE